MREMTGEEEWMTGLTVTGGWVWAAFAFRGDALRLARVVLGRLVH